MTSQVLPLTEDDLTWDWAFNPSQWLPTLIINMQVCHIDMKVITQWCHRLMTSQVLPLTEDDLIWDWAFKSCTLKSLFELLQDYFISPKVLLDWFSWNSISLAGPKVLSNWLNCNIISLSGPKVLSDWLCCNSISLSGPKALPDCLSFYSITLSAQRSCQIGCVATVSL